MDGGAGHEQVGQVGSKGALPWPDQCGTRGLKKMGFGHLGTAIHKHPPPPWPIGPRPCWPQWPRGQLWGGGATQPGMGAPPKLGHLRTFPINFLLMALQCCGLGAEPVDGRPGNGGGLPS